MAAQTAMQKIEMETRSKMQVKQAEIAFEIEKMKVEAEVKSQLMQKEFEYNQMLHQMANESLSSREQKREDSKAKRISQQNQRKNNLPPQKFESNEDSLDGFDLAEFNPR
jgi:hypothetical protein